MSTKDKWEEEIGKRVDRIKDLEDYKAHYDRLFAKSVVVPDEEYYNLISRTKELEAENKKLRLVIYAVYNIDAKFIDADSSKITYRDYHLAAMEIIESYYKELKEGE